MTELVTAVVPSPRAAASNLGRRLQKLRRERGLRLVDVAHGIVSVGYLSMIEQGQRRPSPEVIRALARRLDVDVAVLEADSLGSPKLDDVVMWQDACWAFTQGDYEHAAQLFEAVVTKQSSMVPNATRWLARTYFELGRWDDALRLLVRAVSAVHDPDDSWTDVYIDLLSGLCLLKLGDLDAAQDALQMAADKAGECLPGSSFHMYALGYLGRCLVRRGHMQAALNVFTECYERIDLLMPGNNLEPLAEQCRGRAHSARSGNDLVSAVRWNERANVYANIHRVAAHGATLALEIAAFHLRLNSASDLQRAHDIAQRIIIAMNGERTAYLRSRALLIQAEVALRQGDWRQCLASVDAAAEQTPQWDRPWVHALRAQAHQAAGDAPTAIAQARLAAAEIEKTTDALRRTDELAEPWEVLASLMRRLGETELAWQYMRKAVAGAGVPTALVELATATS